MADTLLPVASDTPAQAIRRAIRYHRHYHQQAANGVPAGPIRGCDSPVCRAAARAWRAAVVRDSWEPPAGVNPRTGIAYNE